MTMTATTAGRPRPSAYRPDVADRLAAEEYRRCVDAIAALEPDDWARPTECPAWTVREMVAHMIGMALMPSSPLQMARQMRAAKKRRVPGAPHVDAITAHQVDLFKDEPVSELTRLMARAGEKGAKGRRRIARIAGGGKLPDPERVNGIDEIWTVGYMLRTILTRDPWMHRVDLVRATGHPHVLTQDHDGVIVADVVDEWADRHGQSYRLTLTGPAGGSWSHGVGGEEIEMDAVEFCRVLSGRATGTGLLATQVPF